VSFCGFLAKKIDRLECSLAVFADKIVKDDPTIR
jgi:hypothetical protein